MQTKNSLKMEVTRKVKHTRARQLKRKRMMISTRM